MRAAEAMKQEELQRQGKVFEEKYDQESNESFVMVKEKTFNRIVEEGIYNIKEQDYENGELKSN